MIAEEELDEGLQFDLLSSKNSACSEVLVLLAGEHRQISPSGDLEEEQGTRNIAASHPGQDVELFRRFF